MPLKKYFSALLILLISAASTPVFAQLTSPSAFYTEQTAYGSDVIYFFSNHSLAELNAEHSSAMNADFVWSQYNGSGWNNILTETNVTSSSLSNISDGCYRVTINDGSTTQTYQCQVMIPAISNANLIVDDSNCATLKLSATYDIKMLSYTNPADGSTYEVKYTPSFRWANGSKTLKVTETNTVQLDAPYIDDAYTVTVSSRLLNTAATSESDSVTAIAVNAAFTFTNTKTKANNEIHTETEGSAPMRINFFGSPDGTEDRSQGKIDAYTWVFGAAGKDYIADPTFVFQDAGTYAVVLTVENNYGCSSTSEATSIVVKDAFVEVPNVFTPNGDGKNDEFRVAYRSIKSFNITIVNRWGRVVYESSNINEGWNGKIGGQKAAPGVYFYDVTAVGYNENETFHKKGFLHLLVGKN